MIHQKLGKSYVVYTDYAVNEEGNLKVFASSYDPNDETFKLGPVTDEKELYTIDNLLEGIKTDFKYEFSC